MVSTYTVSVQAFDDLPFLRRSVTERLAENSVDSPVIDDVVLVLSELLTNAFTHSRATTADTAVSVDDTQVGLAVRHDRRPGTPTPPAESRMPPATALRGRGLAIVDALTTVRHTSATPTTVEFECVVPRHR